MENLRRYSSLFLQQPSKSRLLRSCTHMGQDKGVLFWPILQRLTEKKPSIEKLILRLRKLRGLNEAEIKYSEGTPMMPHDMPKLPETFSPKLPLERIRKLGTFSIRLYEKSALLLCTTD
jgi:hypothetical protein